jgi:hypothetical protein
MTARLVRAAHDAGRGAQGRAPGGGLGAYLGHEPPDNSGHQRTAAES